MKLYEITDQYAAVIDMLDSCEDQTEIEDTLESIEAAFDQKVENIVKLIRSKEAEKEAVLNESKRLKERADKITKSIDFLKEYIKREMQNIGKEKVESTLFNIKLAWNPPKVDIHDESQIPQEYFTVKEIKAVDKRAILESLKNGNDIPGAGITRDRGLRIR